MGRGDCGCADAKAVGARPHNVPKVAACGGCGLFGRSVPPAPMMGRGNCGCADAGWGRRWSKMGRRAAVGNGRCRAGCSLDFSDTPKKASYWLTYRTLDGVRTTILRRYYLPVVVGRAARLFFVDAAPAGGVNPFKAARITAHL